MFIEKEKNHKNCEPMKQHHLKFGSFAFQHHADGMKCMCAQKSSLKMNGKNI